MNEPLPPLNPDPPKSSWLNTFYLQNQAWLHPLLTLIVATFVSVVFHVKLSDVQNSAIDAQHAVHEVKDVQAKKVAVDVRGTPADVAALKEVVTSNAATTQPTK